MNKGKNPPVSYYFFLGTEAELIKMLPVLLSFKKRNIHFKIIASGQNDISKSELLKIADISPIDITISKEKIKQTTIGLFTWFISTLFKGSFILRREFSIDRNNKDMIVHGDTISTVMGTILAKIFHMKLVHVEAGLRSYNYFHPFPEEIDRVLVSNFADIHFCPNAWAVNNLKKKRGQVVNTYQNTLAESLAIALMQKRNSNLINKLKNKKYFIFVVHRQENLYNEKFLKQVIALVQEAAKTYTCLFILHKPTKIVLEKLHLIKELQNNKNIILTERIPYIEFMQIIDNAQFMITDGGSNQEEAYYLGKPCLILRKHTERIEGLNKNILLSGNDLGKITHFIKEHKKYIVKKTDLKKSPSEIITNTLIQL